MSVPFPGNSDSPTKFYVDSGVTLGINNDENNYYDNYGTLIHDGGVFNNRGPTINHGSITNQSGQFKNLKSVENHSKISNNGDWVNWGLATNYKDATMLSTGNWWEHAHAKIDNYGTIRSKGDDITFHITSRSATINVKDSGRLINDQGSRMINDGNINIDKDARLVNKVMCIEFKNWGNIKNYGTIYSFDRFENWDNQEYREDSHNYGNIDNHGTIIIGGDKEFAVFDNMGSVNMYGGVIEAQGGTFRNSGYLTGIGTYKGLDGDRFHNEPGGTFSPGYSAGGFKIEGDLYHSGKKQIEIGGPNDASRNPLDTEHDFIDVAGDMLIEGGKLETSLIDGFKLQRGQEFIIAKVDGKLIGQYDGLDEGDSVGQFESIYGNKIDLFVTYEGGDGNDIALYTKPHTLGEVIFTVLGYDM